MKNVLLSNDDGIDNVGIKVLRDYFKNEYNVFIVAPDRERSATGHSITLHDPIRLRVVENDRVFAVDGTPVDAVHIALLGIIKERIDFVITGINNGLNLGADVFYSGTVSAAFQASAFGIPGIAVSIDNRGGSISYETAAFFAKILVKKIEETDFDTDIILNLNVPNFKIEDIKGVEITRLGKRLYDDRLIEREDPKKKKYYWIEGEHTRDILEDGSDVKALNEGKVSITPLRLDMTALDYIGTLKRWDFQLLK
ncbi:MAG: 5'/3'-nucleotidase SurE [Spirochaetota bacterium]